MKWQVVNKTEGYNDLVIALFRYNSDAAVFVDMLRREYPYLIYVVKAF